MKKILILLDYVMAIFAIYGVYHFIGWLNTKIDLLFYVAYNFEKYGFLAQVLRGYIILSVVYCTIIILFSTVPLKKLMRKFKQAETT